MKASELSTPTNNTPECKERPHKPPFRPAKDDTKLVLQDPIRRSDPIETEEAVLRPPPFQFSAPKSNSPSKMGLTSDDEGNSGAFLADSNLNSPIGEEKI